MTTFVVRLWKADGQEGGGAPGVRGVVEQVATGHRAAFRGASELIAFLEEHIAGAVQPGVTLRRP
jgi:hypothetical protein